MNKYEMMFIVKSVGEGDNSKTVADTYKKIIADLKGKVIEARDLGLKKLAYPIKKEINGYYFVMQFNANNEVINELNRRALIDENLIRHLIIKMEEK